MIIMKKSILLLMSFVLFFGAASFAQDKTKKDEKKKAPVITFKELNHDFGTIQKGGNGVFEFEFKNTGKEPLVLKKVKSSCGCTIPTWPREPIPKKKSNKIRVKYDTNRIGAFNKKITIYSNAKNGNIVLTIKGKVVSKS